MLIWHNPHHELFALADWIAAAAEDAVILTDLATAETALAEPEALPLVMLTDSPQARVAAMLRQGVTPAQALQEWSGEAEAILGVFRRHRCVIRIIDATTARAHPERVAQLLELPRALPEQPQAAATPDPMLMVLAEYSLRVDPALDLLANELAACIPDIAHGLPLPHADPDAAFVSYHLVREEHAENQHRITTEFDKLKNAFSSNLQDIAALQTQQETTTQDAAAREARIAELKAAETQLTNNLEAVHTHLQIERDVAKAQAAELEQRLGQAEKIETALRQELHRVMQSRSVRITAPLRRLGDVLRRLRQTLRGGR